MIISLMVVAIMGTTRVPPDPGDPDYQRGLADWNSWQSWLGELNVAQLSGADYWAAQRNQQNPIPCNSFAANGSDWLTGCIEAQRRLTPVDYRRNTSPQYWNGWNRIGLAEPAPPSPVPIGGEVPLTPSRTIHQGWLGVSLQTVTPEIVAQVGMNFATGALVTSVFRESPADRAGVLTGDIVLGIAGRPASDSADLIRTISGLEAGTATVIAIWRQRHELVIHVVIGERPPAPAAPIVPAMQQPPSPAVAPPPPPAAPIAPAMQLPPPAAIVPPPLPAPPPAPPAQATASSMGAAEEEAIIGTVTLFASRYEAAPNDMAKGAVRRGRAIALCTAVAPADGMVRQWTGKVERLDSTGDGRGILAVRIGPNIVLMTVNNKLSEDMEDFKTLIDPGSPLFQDAVNLSVNQAVIFSGQFARHSDDCMRELSLTPSGAMSAPDFLFRFSGIRSQ
jgi:hypothetical protein